MGDRIGTFRMRALSVIGSSVSYIGVAFLSVILYWYLSEMPPNQVTILGPGVLPLPQLMDSTQRLFRSPCRQLHGARKVNCVS